MRNGRSVRARHGSDDPLPRAATWFVWSLAAVAIAAVAAAAVWAIATL